MSLNQAAISPNMSPYYRKRQDLIDLHCSSGYNGGATGFYAENWPTWRANTDRAIRELVAGERELQLKASSEYAAVIMEAILANKPTVIYGNVLNTGLIDNLPQDGIVEVACLVDGSGIQPTHFGRLPEHLAALNKSNMSFFDLAVTAFFGKGSRNGAARFDDRSAYGSRLFLA